MPIYFREPSINLGVGEVRGPAAPYHGQGVSCASLQASRRIPRRATCPRTSEDFDRPGAQGLRQGRRASTVWRPWSRRFAPSAAGTRRCCWIAATPGKAPTPRLVEPRRQTWSRSMNALGVDAMTAPLGVHLRRRPGRGADPSELGFPLPRRQRASTRSGKSRSSRVDRDVRTGRGQDCRDRPGLSLHAGRQPALHDPRPGLSAFSEKAGPGPSVVAEARAEGAELIVLHEPQRLRR